MDEKIKCLICGETVLITEISVGIDVCKECWPAYRASNKAFNFRARGTKEAI